MGYLVTFSFNVRGQGPLSGVRRIDGLGGILFAPKLCPVSARSGRSRVSLTAFDGNGANSQKLVFLDF